MLITHAWGQPRAGLRLLELNGQHRWLQVRPHGPLICPPEVAHDVKLVASSMHKRFNPLFSVLRASKQRVVGSEDQNLHKVTTMACRAVIEAASRFNRFFSGQMTAAGRVPPAKVRLQPWNTCIP